MSVKRTSKRSVGRARAARGRANLVKLRRVSERDIQRTSPPELADLPDDFWAEATPVNTPSKQPISLRVDQDVLAWFKKQGPRYQSRINAVLRSYVSAMRRRSKRRGAAYRCRISRAPASDTRRVVGLIRFGGRFSYAV